MRPLFSTGSDFSGQAELTFGLKADVTAARKEKREEKFAKTASLTVEGVRVTGGYFQDYIGSWASSVLGYPMPIEGTFHPLYELLTPELTLEDGGLADKTLKQEVNTKQSL